ncbi:MFS multidrug-resistance DHA1 sub-family [Rhizopogon salebrosus TDB-379]|nr:MFS multidrug-resistance DHA1 sub-family [Rhizopogon salebrosus TDB-379]
MVERQADEETPLVQRRQPEQPVTRTPLPWDQFWVVLLVQISDPFATQTLAPFTPQLIRDIGVTHGDESLVAHYVGILQSSYFAAQVLTVLHWSQLSDHIGRKPLLLTALFAVSISMFSFGLSTTFIGLVISRIICGAFDGTNGVVKSVVMDITDATNMPWACNYMPLPFMVGKVIGPVIGGTFSRPADRFPEIFGGLELLKTYPYLLPCAVSATFSAVACLVAYFRLNESVSTRVPLWDLVKERLLQQSSIKPTTLSGHPSDALADANTVEVISKPLPLRAMLTRKVLSVTASYATMALIHVAYFSILPVFYATPIALGGLSFDPPRIGAILGASGFVHGIPQLLFFAPLNDRFGTRAVYTTGILSCIPIVVLFPVTNALIRAYGMGLAVWLAIGVQHTLMIGLTMCYPCLSLFIRTATPNRASFGATNGITQLVVAAGRIIGPASAASVFSYSMQEGHDAWSIYYFLMAIAFLAVGASLSLPRDPSLWEEDE